MEDEARSKAKEELDSGPDNETSSEFMAKLLGRLEDTVERSRQEEAVSIIASIEKMVDKGREKAAEPAVPARSATRAVPADVADWRYRSMPEWQREVRNADVDVLAQRFFRALAQGDRVVLRQIHEEHGRAALLEGDSTAGAPFGGTGGQLLPLPLANMVLATFYQNNRIYQYAQRFQAGAGASLRLPIQDGEPTSNWVAEATAPSDGSPTASDFIQLQLQKHMNVSEASNELIEDSAFNVGTWLSNQVGMTMAEAEDISMWQTGAGSASNEPIGLETADTTTLSAPAWYVKAGSGQAADNTAAGAISLAVLLDMWYALPEMERRGAIWAGNGAVASLLSRITDPQGRQILRMQNDAAGVVGDSVGGASTTSIFNRPFVEMPGGTAADQTGNRLYLTNLARHYFILERGGLRAAVSQESKFTEDTTVFKFIHRVDGQPVANDATNRYRYVYTGNLQTAE